MTDAGAGVDAASARDAAIDAPRSELDAALAPGWRSEPDVPVAIQEIAGAVLEGDLVIAGGLDAAAAVVRSVRRYDVDGGGGWSSLPDLPEARHHLMLVALGGDLYALGGMQTLRFEPLDTAWVLRAGASEWTDIAPLPDSRAAGVAGAIDGRIVIGSGQSERGLVTAALIYDPAMDAWSTSAASLPTPREHTAGFVHDGELYVVAGRMFAIGSNEALVHAFDPALDAWRAVPPTMVPRGGHGVALLDGRAYAVGGETMERALDSVEVLDLADPTAWAASTPVPTRRHGHVVLAAGGRIWVIGGATVPSLGADATMESFAPPP